MLQLLQRSTTSNNLSPQQLRTALAFAEAIIPGSASIRTADERTLSRIQDTLLHLSPMALKGWGHMVTVLNQAAVLRAGRPFDQLTSERQQQLLNSWVKDPVIRAPLAIVALAFKFVHFDMPEVYGKMGGKLNVVQHMEEPQWLSQIMPATDWDDGEDIECEVVVVGTGAGGAVVGKELAERGYAVVFVEEGDHHRRDSFTGSSLQAHRDLYKGSLTFGNAIMPIFAGRLVGGSTAINTASCFRTPPWVLERWCEDIGTSDFSPETMAPYFERVENFIEVGPANPKAAGPILDVMRRGCESLGWSWQLMQRNAPGCNGEGFCDFGCRTDARKSTNLSYIPAALKRGAMTFTGMTADRLIIENGKARGVVGRDRAGREIRVRADVVVFSGGSLSTPLFLMKHGIFNDSGQVGRNLTVHPSSAVSGLFDEAIEGHRYIPQGCFISEHMKDGLLISTAQADKNFAGMIFPVVGQALMERIEDLWRTACFSLLMSDQGAGGRVVAGPNGMPIAQYSLTAKDVTKMHRGMNLMVDFLRAAGASKVFPVVSGYNALETPSDFRHFREHPIKASALQLTSYHPLGTCKLGKDPRNSVVDLNHETHALKNFYVVDGSTVPGPLGVNPQITIMAMATRASERIAERLANSVTTA